jgi:hypothetical protein
MTDTVETVRVVATHPSQGDWVVINKSDYNPEVHTLYGESAPTAQDSPVMKRGRPRKVNMEQDNG